MYDCIIIKRLSHPLKNVECFTGRKTHLLGDHLQDLASSPSSTNLHSSPFENYILKFS